MAPTNIGTTFVSKAPRTSRAKNGGIRVQYEELVEGSVQGSATFAQSLSYVLQPGLSTTFPWVSTQAAQYEQYIIHSVSYQYIPITNTSSSGDIIMFCDYNPQDPAPLDGTGETEAMDHPGAVCGSVWDTHVFHASTKLMHAIGPRKFVRTVNIAGDPKTYDCGKFYLYTNNCADIPIGKLRVFYDIEFFCPQIRPHTELLPSTSSRFYLKTIQTMVDETHTPLLWRGPNETGVSLLMDPLRFNTNSAGATGLDIYTFYPPAGIYHISVRVQLVNSVDENSTGYIELYKNASAYPMASNLYRAIGYMGGVGTSLTLEDIISFNGTDTFSVTALCGPTLTGAGLIVAASMTVSLA